MDEEQFKQLMAAVTAQGEEIKALKEGAVTLEQVNALIEKKPNQGAESIDDWIDQIVEGVLEEDPSIAGDDVYEDPDYEDPDDEHEDSDDDWEDTPVVDTESKQRIQELEDLVFDLQNENTERQEREEAAAEQSRISARNSAAAKQLQQFVHAGGVEDFLSRLQRENLIVEHNGNFMYDTGKLDPNTMERGYLPLDQAMNGALGERVKTDTNLNFYLPAREGSGTGTLPGGSQPPAQSFENTNAQTTYERLKTGGAEAQEQVMAEVRAMVSGG